MNSSQKIKLGKICVYSHHSKGKLVYIGKGTADRPYNFLHRSDVWKKFFSEKDDIEIKILGWFDTNDEAVAFEKNLIKAKQPECNIAHTKRARSIKPETKGAKRNFSISMYPSDLETVDAYIQKFLDETGFPITRNGLVRRAVLMHLEMMERDDEEAKRYKEIFKKVGI